MLKMPVKILSDDDRFPFIPFVTLDGVFVNGTDLTAADYFNDRYTKKEVDDMFEALGTVMDFRGVVETEAQLPETAEPGDVYLVLHYEESTITHGVIWQDGKGWTDMGTPIDLDDYYVKEEVDELVKTSIRNSEIKEREQTDTDIANCLKKAKEYTDTSIYDLHMENYLTSDEVEDYVANNHTIPYYKGTPDEPLYINTLFPVMEDQCNYIALLAGNVKASEDAEAEGLLMYGLYIITVISQELHQYCLTCYRENSTEQIYTITDQAADVVTAALMNTESNYIINGDYFFTNTVKVGRDPIEDNDVVNKKYLDEAVIIPMQKLIARLAGEDVSKWQ